MNKANFEQSHNGKSVELFHIFSNNLSCYITNYGARIVSLNALDFNLKKVDVVLGFNTLDQYLHATELYHGATIGRYANRIANGKFTLNDEIYTLTQNSDANSLHGGNHGFHNQVWSCIFSDNKKVVLKLFSPHMQEGFPGDLVVQVTYSIEGSTLKVEYEASSTADTIINLTNHSYFNLNGEGSGSILNHFLSVNSEYFTPIDSNSIPTGKLEMVHDTPFDFTSKKEVGKDIDKDHEQLIIGKGYDHNFVLNQFVEGALNFAAESWGDKSKIKMEVWSTEPGIQFYIASHLDGSDKGKSDIFYRSRDAFCLETQHFPDSPNHPQFPTTILKENQLFNSVTEYRFSID